MSNKLAAFVKSKTQNYENYVKLINGFLATQISVEVFDKKYRALWSKRVRIKNRKTPKNTVAKEEVLITALRDGAISGCQFNRKWIRLHGFTRRTYAIEEALGALHSTVSNYTTDERLLATGTYVREHELREHAKQVLKVLRKLGSFRG